MREAARALDDVSDHLGEVLRRADELLAEWSKFGAQVRGQVEREAAAVGQIVDEAVGRVAAQGIDRAITERLRALTLEIERLEQRTRAASHAAVEQRENDRRILWAVVAGIVLANALLVVLLLRKPEARHSAEPIRLDSTSAPQSSAEPAQGTGPGATPVGAANPVSPGSPETVESTTPAPGSAPAGAVGGPNISGAGAPNPGAAPNGGPGGTQPGSAQQGGGQSGALQGRAQQGGIPQGANTTPGAAAKSISTGSGGAHPIELTGPKTSPIALPPKAGAAHPRKKLP